MNRPGDWIPRPVLEVMEQLERKGFRAWVVGGSLRDLLRGKPPHDFDLASNAPPQKLAVLLPDARVVETGLRFGTVTVLYGGMSIEITRLRVEGDYRDGRRPNAVSPTEEIAEDLARRDFTINAMAWRPGEEICDPFGGRQDLKSGLLRAVGRPRQRFEEDALRILRGMRFASQMGYRIEGETAAAIHETKGLLKQISAERICEEIWRMILGEHPVAVMTEFADVVAEALPELAPMMGFPQHSLYHIYDVWGHTLRVIAGAPQEPVTRMAALLHDCGKPQMLTMDRFGHGHFKGHAPRGALLADEICRRLKMSRRRREQVVQLVRWHDEDIPPNDAQVRRWLGFLGEEQMRRFLDLQEADSRAKSARSDTQFAEDLRRRMEQALARKDCCRIDQLNITGRELMALGIPQKEIGRAKQALLEQALEDPARNSPPALRENALAWWRRQTGQPGAAVIF